MARHHRTHSNVVTKCYKCDKNTYGRLILNRSRRIIDSPGIMMFSDTGIKCERCMALEGTADPNLPITEGPKFGKEYLDEQLK